MNAIQGLHHITAIARDPQQNLSFYENTLGQRLVKTTVNFDDPGTYHLYYGDETGTPGTIMTFFPWPRIARGSAGAGETGAVAYAIPAGAHTYWMERLASFNLNPQRGAERFGQQVILFDDPDGMQLELIEVDAAMPVRFWDEGPVPAAYALRGFHSVTLWLNHVEQTARLLTERLGYTADGINQEPGGTRYRFKAAADGPGAFVDLLYAPDLEPGRFGAGSVHHIAFRTTDDEEQLAYLEALRNAGEQVTPVKDRQYFHSIYFRSPGGVLFEIATDAPGFLHDEPIEALGQHLKLPPWLEVNRAKIEATLPKLERSPTPSAEN